MLCEACSVQDQEAGFGSMSFHPEGLIVAGGNEEKNVIVWDVKNQQADLLTTKKLVRSVAGHRGHSYGPRSSCPGRLDHI